MENKKIQENISLQQKTAITDAKDIGNWDILTNDKSGELNEYSDLWSGLKKDNDKITLEHQLKNASDETNICVNMINAKYDDDVNIIVPDIKKGEEELALSKVIDYLKEAQYRGVWSKEEAHDIYLTMQKLPISIVARTNLSVLLYNTFHPQEENNLDTIEEDDDNSDDDDDDDDDDEQDNEPGWRK